VKQKGQAPPGKSACSFSLSSVQPSAVIPTAQWRVTFFNKSIAKVARFGVKENV
jgi:hypothetical protein